MLSLQPFEVTIEKRNEARLWRPRTTRRRKVEAGIKIGGRSGWIEGKDGVGSPKCVAALCAYWREEK